MHFFPKIMQLNYPGKVVTNQSFSDLPVQIKILLVITWPARQSRTRAAVVVPGCLQRKKILRDP